ncbi:MAG: HupE/UreJ family protein [Methylomonas sp.]|jgi:urease accessory protein|uniref:HupE/UreJ family protein n=1 Tax=Methylomonas sp. TaxID=418 RepID=UPI0025F238D0|nr:HupE/UreJ family protein [Methylomonas sp.]MCK9606646.1 HupE/UreJ family protein [Methylomonas sp.]
MQPNRTSKSSDSGFGPSKLLLSFCIQPLLLLAFLSKQFFNFDLIGLSHGFTHPLMGWDHLLTMLAVGIWAAQLRGKAIWVLPLAFVGVMSLGGLAGAAGLSIPSVEGIILLSCAVFSLLITHKVRFNANINVMIVAFFAFFHGFAHGQEISTSASLISYTVGFMLATLLLHGAGILVAKLAIFSITCLLTALFSSSAIAETTDSNVEDSKKVLSRHSRQTAPAWFGSGQAAEIDAYFTFGKERMRAANCSVQGAGEGGCADLTVRPISEMPPDFVKAAPEHRSGKLSTFNGEAVYSPGKPAAADVCSDRRDPGLYPADNPPLGPDFKRCFPDINHTPGTHLLSNGVGLTSPPLVIVSLPQVFPLLGNSPISRIEAFYLQSILATISIRNNQVSVGFQYRSPDLARSLVASRPAIPGPFNCFTNLVPQDSASGHSRRVSMLGLALYGPQLTDYRFESSA